MIKFRILLWLGLFGVTGWFLYMAVVPSGHIVYVHDFDDNDYFVHKLSPADRLGERTGEGQAIIGDPAYFTLRTPRTFDTARLTYKYRNTGELPLIESGVLVDNTIWRYDLKPIENRIIDQLAMVWDKTEEDGVVLLQRQRRYQSVAEFLANLPAREETAIYNYDLDSEYLIPEYATSAEGTLIDKAIRGSYQFYTYVGNEELDAVFTIIDMNKNGDPDPVDIHLYYDDQMIDSRHLEDDGVAEESGESKEARNLEFKLPNLPEGVYKLELRANDDIVTTGIKSQQGKLAFINKLWLADSGKTDFSLFTNGSELHAQTTNPDRLQRLAVGGENFDIAETYRQYSRRISGTSTEIGVAKDDVVISGNGVFAFSRDALIDPRFKKVSASLDINANGVNYVIADYDFPAESGGWYEASAEFELAGAYRENQGYSFVISIPGLKADDDLDDSVELGEIKVELWGRSLGEKMKEKFNKE